MDLFLETLKNETFVAVKPSDYAIRLRDLYRRYPKNWEKSIVPLEEALKLRAETNNDFSVVWHGYCDSCFKYLNKNTCETWYCSLDETVWLCKDCFDTLKIELNLKLKS